MKLLFFIPFIFLIISCASSSVKEPDLKSPPLPPGIEFGETWSDAEEYGYTEKIYSTPEYLAKPKKGSSVLMTALMKKYETRSCRSAPPETSMKIIVGKNGTVLEVLPNSDLSGPCYKVLSDIIQGYEFYPAKYNDEPVNMKTGFLIRRQ